MSHYPQPSIGTWYEDIDNHQIFEVVATDEEAGFIEIQYFAGEVGEFEIDTWNQLHLAAIAAPEDWSGPFELEKEDLQYSDEPFHPVEWNNPISNYDLKS